MQEDTPADLPPATDHHHLRFFSTRLYVNWRFMRGIEAQFLALQKGFTELIPQHLLKPFDHKELEVNTLFLLSKPEIINHLEFFPVNFFFFFIPPNILSSS